MACEKKQKGMVFHQEGAPTSATAPGGNHPPPCSVVSQLGEAGESRMEGSSRVTSEEAEVVEANMYPLKEGIGTPAGFPALKFPTSLNPQPVNLSPDVICKGIRVTLDNNSMWNEFFRCKTEMILTKQGSRMFPYCRFRISGLQPSKKYSLLMDIQPLDNNRYKWTSKSWQVAGKAECQVKSKPFTHPESPSTGQHWMQNPVSFYKLKLTNNISEEGNTLLHPMHRYSPRLHVVQTDKAAKDIKLNAACVVTFSFPQTEFIAVTAYQNSRFAQLKVDYNPFAKGLKEDGSSSLGLKLKLKCKDSHKAGSTTTDEHPPVKDSLKCLLVNHKPRSSKALDFKCPVSSDLKNSTTNGNQSDDQVPEGSLCSSQPAQKLFSELIREAHVSLQRCNLEQLDIDRCPSHTRTTALGSNREDVSKMEKTHSETLCVKNCETGFTSKRKFKQDLLNSLNSKDNASSDYSEVTNVTTAPVVGGYQKTSVDPNHKPAPAFPSDVNIKQHKRPAPLPLPALALFLKQHLTKSKKSKNNPGFPPPVVSSESQSSAEVSTCLLSDQPGNANGPLKDLTGNMTESNHQVYGQATADIQPAGKAVEASFRSSSPSCLGAVSNVQQKVPRTDEHLASESPGTDMAVPDDGPVPPNSNQQLCSLGTFSSTCPTVSTSFASPVFSLPLDTVFNVLNSPQTSTLPPDSLLSYPECSPFAFKALSDSPEPLPPLPASLAFELDSTSSETTLRAEPTEESSQNVYSTPTVLKWHTVLPPPVPYIDTSYTTFQSTSQPLSLVSITSPLLPSLTPTHTEPLTFETSTSMALVDPTLSFQQNVQSLPFPGELSPLALQLPLSPTFSSLDGDGLSPTPSIADLVHFFSTDDDLGMGVEFSNSEAVTCSPPISVEAIAHEPGPAKKPCKSKKSRRRKLANMETDEKVDNTTYNSMQPNLEEVEEQLFISFTSKEALKLHIADPPEDDPTTPEGHLPPPADTPENAESVERICSCEKILLRDLKLMKHKQVIHPVLQEVGLKMNLLDPSLAIDLQYLGVHLPIPPTGASQEPLIPSQAFVSRTGKTTDVTQIKGWRDKFTASEAPPTPSVTPEAGPSSDPPKKNLSAFCSDMLDEYLENEGKLIDQRAASLSQPVVEPVVYELPTRSTSYVRTLDSVLKKHTASSPTSDLISGFVPPSKRSRLSLKETKPSSKERRPKGPKKIKFRPEPTADPSAAEPNQVPEQPAVPQSETTTPVTEPHKSKKHQRRKSRFDHAEPITLSPQTHTLQRRRKLKPKSLCQNPSPPRSPAHCQRVSEEPPPLESDSELGAGADQGDTESRPVMTRALLRQKDLEDGVVWEGLPRTSVTKERATIALTSLFTLLGFVSENPTAPVQLVRRRAPPCLNDFCRLGCVCASLSRCSRISHCGRPHCMFGCSCLKQKVVLLKNLDGSDSSPSNQGNNRRRRRRRMKMAYILKEADSVSQPAELVRTLWKRDGRDSDPDPTFVPDLPSLLRSSESRDNSSCARVRAYTGKKETDAKKTLKPVGLKGVKQRDLTLKEAKTRAPSPPAATRPVSSGQPQSPPSKTPSKPSKRLIIIAECQWATTMDRDCVLKRLCDAMALDRLDQPFRIGKYFINPTGRTLEQSGRECCIQYKVHITRTRDKRETPAVPQRSGNQMKERPQPLEEGHLKQVSGEAEPQDAWQWQITEEEPLEAWQQEVEEGEIQEEECSTPYQMDKRSKRRAEDINPKEKKKKMVSLALPFLTGISPAGFLSARRRQPGGTDHLVQVNGKLYPLAKIQLGKMGALHPANRLAAYLTGRVGSSRKQLGSSSSSSQSSKPPQAESSDLNPQTNFLASSNVFAADTTPPRPQPSVTAVTPLQSNTVPHSPGVPEAGAQVIAVRLYPNPAAGRSQVTQVASGSSTPSTASQVSSSIAQPLNRCAAAPPTGQRMVLQPVHKASGVQYYRVPDGKLVQLLPISKLRAVNTALRVPRGRAPPSFLPPASGVTVENQPQTSLPSSPLSDLQSCSVTPPTPLGQGAGFLSQKTTCTFKILPTKSNKEPIIISCPKLPHLPPTPVVTTPSTLLKRPPETPGPLLDPVSFKVAEGQGVELWGKTGKMSADSQNPTTSLTPPPPSGLEVTPLPPADPELASDLMDLDIICVDDEMGLVTTETQVIDLAGSSSGETENSSDFGDDSYSEEETDTTVNQKTSENLVCEQRHVHNMLERRRRVRMQQMFRGLRREVGLRNDRTSKVATLKKAEQVIQELRSTEAHLRERKRRLMKRRDHFLSTIAPTGHKEQGVLKELEQEERHPAANQLRAPVGGGASEPALSTGNTSDDDIIIISSNVQLQTLQVAPSTALSSTKPVPTPAPVTTLVQTSVPGPVPTPVPATVPAPVPVQMSRRILQLCQPRQAPPPVSHSTSVVRDRPKTKPNILSRSKIPVPTVLTTIEAPSAQVLVPAEVLSLIGAALPGQQILTLSPLRPVVLQKTAPTPGVASVDLNAPNLTNQQVQLSSLPCPQTESQTFSENLLHPPQPPEVVSTGPDLPSVQIIDQGPPSSSTLCRGLSVARGPEVGPEGPLGARPETRADSGPGRPTSPREIMSVNQRTISTVMTAGVAYEVDRGVGGAEQQGRDYSVAMETEHGGLQGHMETMQTDPQTGPTDGNTTGGALAPPPLLQMKVGGAKMADTASSDGAGRGEGAMAWRPMPRLVPLGLRGNPPS